MTSTEDRMRENRRVLAEVTETARAVAQAAHPIPETAHEARSELVHLADTARQIRKQLGGWILLLAGVGGAGAWIAAEFLRQWVESFFR